MATQPRLTVAASPVFKLLHDQVEQVKTKNSLKLNNYVALLEALYPHLEPLQIPSLYEVFECVHEFLNSFQPPLELQRLSLQNNQLRSLPSNFHLICTNLRYLDLHFNHFTSFPLAVSEFHKLEILDLSSNQLWRLNEADFQLLEHLRVLSIKDNKFKYLPPFLGSLNSLNLIEVLENPLVRPLVESVRALQKQFPDLEWVQELKAYLRTNAALLNKKINEQFELLQHQRHALQDLPQDSGKRPSGVARSSSISDTRTKASKAAKRMGLIINKPEETPRSSDEGVDATKDASSFSPVNALSSSKGNVKSEITGVGTTTTTTATTAAHATPSSVQEHDASLQHLPLATSPITANGGPLSAPITSRFPGSNRIRSNTLRDIDKILEKNEIVDTEHKPGAYFRRLSTLQENPANEPSPSVDISSTIHTNPPVNLLVSTPTRGHTLDDHNHRQQQQQQLHQHQQQQQQQQQQHKQSQPPYNSRSNSIFNSIIQFPVSNQNSISGPSGIPSKANSISNSTNTFSAGSNVRGARLPSLGGDFTFNPLDFDFTGAGSMSWQQHQLQQQQLQMLLQPLQHLQIPPPSTGSKSKSGSLENIWDKTGWESLVGLPLNNENLTNIVTGITNGSILLSGTNNERRDSVLKYLNEQPQSLQKSRGRFSDMSKDAPPTQLREDIFENVNNAGGMGSDQTNPRLSSQVANGNTYSGVTVKGSQSEVPEPVSPSNSSLSSKTSTTKPYSREDEPQSPKTSPSGFNAKLRTTDQLKQQPPSHLQIQQHPNYGVMPGYSANAYQQLPTDTSNSSSRVQRQKVPYSNPKQQNLVPAQQFVQAEDGRPLLGATKIDQLMLVIQARDNGINGAIPQGSDGSILANPETVVEQTRLQKPGVAGVIPQPIGLVGGIEKPGKRRLLNEKADGSSNDGNQGHTTKKRSKDHQCPYCFKYFTQSTHLDVHVRSHIGFKPFECSYCHKRFTQGGNLRTHLRLHTGEKPFTCKECNRSFSRKGNLAAHLLTHKNEKPFKCKLDGCDKAFTQLGNLKSHQNRFHLDTLNNLTHRLAELTGSQLSNLPPQEKNLLEYFKELYKNSNKGIRGRGKGPNHSGGGGHDVIDGVREESSSMSPLSLNGRRMVSSHQPGHRQNPPPPLPPQQHQRYEQLAPHQISQQQQLAHMTHQGMPQYGFDMGYRSVAK